MHYIAIVGKTLNEGENVYQVFYTPDCIHGEVKAFGETALVAEILKGGHHLVNATADPISGRIIEDFGSFKRLKPVNGVVPHIVLAKYASATGTVLGYFLLNSANGQIIRAKPSAVYSACAKARKNNGVFLQNGIYRNSDGKEQIAAYPGKSFYTLIRKLKKEPKQVNSEVDIKRNRDNLKKKQKTKYTKEQLKEFANAQKMGIDPIIIANPKLSPEQMRVLWVGKKNGACVEYFANPKYSIEQMQFLVARLVNKQAVIDCRVLLNPKYSVKQMNEIYLGYTDGIDYTIYADPTVSVDNMFLQRQTLLAEGGMMSDIYAESNKKPVTNVSELRDWVRDVKKRSGNSGATGASK